MQRAESGAMQVQLLELAQLFVDLPLVPEQVLPMQQQRRQKVQRPDEKQKFSLVSGTFRWQLTSLNILKAVN